VQELGGSIARQVDKLANGNIPYHKRHAQFMNVVGRGGRKLSAFWFSKRLNFSGSSALFQNFVKSMKIQGVRDLYSGTGCRSVIRW